MSHVLKFSEIFEVPYIGKKREDGKLRLEKHMKHGKTYGKYP